MAFLTEQLTLGSVSGKRAAAHALLTALQEADFGGGFFGGGFGGDFGGAQHQVAAPASSASLSARVGGAGPGEPGEEYGEGEAVAPTFYGGGGGGAGSGISGERSLGVAVAAGGASARRALAAQPGSFIYPQAPPFF